MSLPIAKAADRAATFASYSADARVPNNNGSPMRWQEVAASLADNLETVARFYRDECRSAADAQPQSVRLVSQGLAGRFGARGAYRGLTAEVFAISDANAANAISDRLAMRRLLSTLDRYEVLRPADHRGAAVDASA